MRTLEQIIEKEKQTRQENGDFGIKACKESILAEIGRNERFNLQNQTNKYTTSLYVLLEKYVERANNDVFFNNAMVLACWELINKK